MKYLNYKIIWSGYLFIRLNLIAQLIQNEQSTALHVSFLSMANEML